MDDREARALLSLVRADETEFDDARFGEALQQAESYQELDAWWEEEQALDRAIAGKLESVPLPPGLKARLTLPPRTLAVAQRSWSRVALLAAAIIVAAAVFSARGADRSNRPRRWLIIATRWSASLNSIHRSNWNRLSSRA